MALCVWPLRELAQGLDVGAGGLGRGGQLFVGDIGQILGIYHDVDAGQFAHLAQLQRGEGRLQRSTPPDDHNLADRIVVQGIQCTIGDVGGMQ
ncbi:Uncharacterised protein [Mycobacteroides abscessus subsp. abscessus]|nr:Uncharacterised protein [Mycobacteroides abscessus subsp. abscessus]